MLHGVSRLSDVVFSIFSSPVSILTSTFDAIYAADLWLRYFVVL
jgi:hypothetical protein